MNNAVIAPAVNPTWTSAVVLQTEHAWVLGSAGLRSSSWRAAHKLHQDAGYMSELRFLFVVSLDGGEASIYVLELVGRSYFVIRECKLARADASA
jgi:hypothetical protein